MAAETARALSRWLVDRQSEMLELLELLVSAESPSLEPRALERSFAIVAAELEQMDFAVRRIRGEGTGDHLYARPAVRCRGAPRQLLIGHMDTVWPIGTLAGMPLRREGGLLFGPGTADMKGGLVEIVFALRALRELGFSPSVTPVVLVNSDEEIGSIDSCRVIRLLASGAERAFVLEAGEGPGGRLKIARKGVGEYAVRVRGRPSHAGADFARGTSAILELAHQVQSLFALNNQAQGITVNVGMIDGGLRPNVVAPSARAIVDVRAPTVAAADALDLAIRRLRPAFAGTTVEVEGGFHRMPMEPLPRNRVLLATAKRLGRELGLQVEDAGLVGGASDANITSLVTGTLDGLGPVGDGSHAVDEHIDLSRLPERTALLALLLLEPVERPRLVGRRRRRDLERGARAATRIAVLGTDASATNVEIVEVWRVLGIDAHLVDARLAAATGRWDFVLGRLDVLSTIDGVEPGLLGLFRLERSGHRVLNTCAALAAAHDKLLTSKLLVRAGLPHPRTERVGPVGGPPRLRPPVVVKPRLGSWGVDVCRCDTDAELTRCIDELRTRPWFERRGALVQELIPPVGHDLRLVVAGGSVIGATRRVAAPGEWRTNISLGGTREPVDPSATAQALGIAAAAAIHADLVGIDLLPVDGGFTVLELNGAVDFNSAYSHPGHDIFQDAALALGILARAPARTI